MSIRPERVANAMRREIAAILERELRDPGVSGMVSVTDVEVNDDLSTAKVFVSVLGGADEQQRALQALARATPFVRRQLAPRLGLREMPELRFKLDTSIERGARVEELLRKLHDGEPIPDEDE
jgi:ribosome-binding factor A